MTSTSAPTRFVPQWRREEADPPTFLLRAGSVIERESLEAELAGEHRAGRVWPYELANVLCDAFRAIGGEDVGLLLSLVEREQAHALKNGDPLDDGEQATLDGARQIAIEYWPDYAALVAQMQRRELLLPILAFRRFCTGWENVKAPYKRGLGGFVDDAALKGVDPLQLRAAGIEAYNLLYLDPSAEKNSAAPSPSSDTPPISGSGAPLAPDGTLAPTDGVKTPPSSFPATSASPSSSG